MIVTELEAPLYLPPPPVPRSPGIHVSNIIRCLAGETGILRPEWVEELSLADARTITDPVSILRINIGLAWEKHYIPMLPDVIDHPGEMQYEGIYLTHDGESVSVIITESKGQRWELLVHEVKATYKSSRNVAKDLGGQWMWMSQIKAYCKAKATRYATLHTLFLCGDYSYPIRPQLKKWLIEFSQEEIDANWSLLMDYKAYRQQKEGWID